MATKKASEGEESYACAECGKQVADSEAIKTRDAQYHPDCFAPGPGTGEES